MQFHLPPECPGAAVVVVPRRLAPVLVGDEEGKGLAPVPVPRQPVQVDMEAVVHQAHLPRLVGTQVIAVIRRDAAPLPGDGVTVQVQKTLFSHDRSTSLTK